MAVFIEDWVVSNLIISYSTFSTCCNIVNLKKSKSKYLTAIVIHLLFQFLLLYRNKDILFFLLYIFYIVTEVIIIQFKENKSKFCLTLLCFTAMSLLTNALTNLLFLSEYIRLYLNYNNEVVMLITTLSSLLICFISKAYSVYRRREKIVQNLTYKISIHIGDKVKELSAFLDTGNCLYDKNNLPVILLNVFELEEIVSKDDFKKLLFGDLKIETLNIFTLNINSINSKKTIPAFIPDYVSIEGMSCNVKACIGIIEKNIKKSTSCGALLHPELILGG